MYTIVFPAACSALSVSKIALRLCGSTPTVGSSNTSSSGSCKIAAPMLRRRFIPPLYRDTGSVVAHGVGASVNGQDPRSNVYLLDGTPQNDSFDVTVGAAGPAGP